MVCYYIFVRRRLADSEEDIALPASRPSIRRRLLLPAIILTFGAAASPAQDTLTEVVITATPLRENVLETAQPVRALDGDALLRERAASLGETLARQPGVSASWFGPQSSRPLIRGVGGERVQMYQDGSDALDASGLSNDHAVTIDPLLAERIEIVRGPATLLFGNSASAGLVNVLTRRIPRAAADRPFRGSIELRGDSALAERALAAQAELGEGPWRLHADLHRRTTDDVRIPGFATVAALREPGVVPGRLENSASETRGGGLGLSRVGDWGHVGIALSRFDTQYEIPGLGDAEQPDGGDDGAGEGTPPLAAARVGVGDGIYLDMGQTRWDLDADLRGPIAGITTLQLRAGFNDYEHAEVEPGGEIGTIYLQRGLEARAAAEHAPIAGWRGMFGVQWRDLDLEAIGEEAFVPPSVTRNLGLFLFEERRVGALTAEFGVRLERQQIDLPAAASTYDDEAVSASAGLIWRLSEGWRATVNLHSIERHPTATELFADGPHIAVRRFEIGDADLGTERALALDVGLHAAAGRLRAALSAFFSDYSDYIYAAPTGAIEDGLPVVVYTAIDARFGGLEAELVWQGPETALGRWSARVFGDYVRAEDGAGAPLPQIPPLRLGASLGFDRGPLGIELRAVWNDAQDRIAAGELPTDAFTLVDFDLTWRARVADRPMTLFVRGANLFDKEARRHASPLKDFAPLPGRALGLGVRFDF
jgi:iron complex outermembrane receptor protein